MTAPTASMIKAGADWLRLHDADKASDYTYEQLVTLIWTAMDAARGDEMQPSTAGAELRANQQRWDDAVAREMVGKQPTRTPEEMRRATARVRGGR